MKKIFTLISFLSIQLTKIKNFRISSGIPLSYYSIYLLFISSFLSSYSINNYLSKNIDNSSNYFCLYIISHIICMLL